MRTEAELLYIKIQECPARDRERSVIEGAHIRIFGLSRSFLLEMIVLTVCEPEHMNMAPSITDLPRSLPAFLIPNLLSNCILRAQE